MDELVKPSERVNAGPDGRTTPALDELAMRAVERGIVDSISRRHLGRILEAGDIYQHSATGA